MSFSSQSEQSNNESIEFTAKRKTKIDYDNSFCKAQQIINSSTDVIELYELYLKFLLGRQYTKEDQINIAHYWGVPFQANVSQQVLPECILRFPNPDSDLIQQYTPLPTIQAFDNLQKSFKLNMNDKQDIVLMKAIETTFLHLTPYGLNQRWMQQRGNLYQRLGQRGPSQMESLKSEQQDNEFQRLESSHEFLNSELDLVKTLINQMQFKLLGTEVLVRTKWQEAFDIDFKQIRETKMKIMQNGKYHKMKSNKVWNRSTNDTADYLTLIRNICLLLIMRQGFYVQSFISPDGQHIICQLFPYETNLQMVAQKHQLNKKLNFWFTDIFSLEPVDNGYRPLRLNNRLWKPDDYETSLMFSYLRPMIIQLIKSINFKRIAKDLNLTRINQSMFKYGDKDINDDDPGPTDTEWFAYYKYLVHLEKELSKVRESFLIENDIGILINKQLKPIELYLIRNKNKLHESNINKKNIKESRYHMNEYQKYQQRMQQYLNDYQTFYQGNPNTKQIKMVKQEKLGNEYLQIFLEALRVANADKKHLYTLWERSKLEKFETFTTFTIPSHSISPSLQIKNKVCWAKYQLNENKQISFFSPQERLKLINLAISDILALNELMGNLYINQFFCVNDHYELYGHCEFPLEPLSLDTTFYQKKLYNLENLWKFKITQPWSVPYMEICSYYGEKIGLYFYYTSYFTQQLSIISIIGFTFNLLYWLINDPEDSNYQLLNIIFPFIQIQWTNFFAEYWQQKQILFNLYNGQNAKTNEAQVQRSNFRGTYKRSVEDDSMNSLYINVSEFYTRLSISGLILLLILALYSGIVVGLFMITISLRDALKDQLSIPKALNLEVTITATINIIILTFLDSVYEFVSTQMTDFENQRTISEYENSFVLKKYILYFASYVGPLVILNFLNSMLHLYCEVDNCAEHVKYHFATIIIWIFFFKTIKIARVAYKQSKIPIFKHTFDQEDLKKFILEQSTRQSYSKSPERYGTLEDYMDVFILNTLLSIFGYSFPASFIFIWLQNIVQLQADKAKFLYLLQRPWPQNTFSLGVWGGILEFISYVCILTNTGQMTAVYSKVFGYELLLVYLSFFILNFFLKFIIQGVFGDVPYELLLMIQRQKYILKTTIEQFAKSKASNSSNKSDHMRRFPIHKVFGVVLKCHQGNYETMSSFDILEDHYLLKSAQKHKFGEEKKQNVKLELLTKQLTRNLAKQAENPKPEVLKSIFQNRQYNWAYDIKKWVRFNQDKLLENYKLMYRINLLNPHKLLWTDMRVSQRYLHIKRKKKTLINLDARKLNIYQENIKKMKQYNVARAENKFKKQFKMVDPTSNKPDDIREYEALVEKNDKFIEKHTWLDSRKVIVLKFKGIWFHGFRKQAIKMPAKKAAMKEYQKSQVASKAKQQNGLISQFEKIVENQNTLDFSLFDFCNNITKLEINKQIEEVKFPLSRSSMNHVYYLISQQKSLTFKNTIDQYKDTYIFDNQTQKLQEFVMEYFIQDIFKIPEYRLQKQLNSNTWLAKHNDNDCLLQFIQIKHGEILKFQPPSKSKLGVYCVQSLNYVRLSNLIDQIDDFSVKGYCLSVYPFSTTLTLRSIIKYRSTYSIEYLFDEILQFLYAILMILKEKPYGELNSNNLFFVDREYILLNPITNQPDIFNLAVILLEMMTLNIVEDPIEAFNKLPKSFIKQVIHEMIYENPSIDQLLDTIKYQQKFQEIAMVQNMSKSLKLDLDDYVQLMMHGINMTFRLKQYNLTILYVKEVEGRLSEFLFKTQDNFLTNLEVFLRDNFLTVLVKPNYLQLISNIILINYYKNASKLQLFEKDIRTSQVEIQIDIEESNQIVRIVEKCQNQLDGIINELKLNIRMTDLSVMQKNALLKRRNTMSYDDIKNQQKYESLKEYLRKNQNYFKIIYNYNLKLLRMLNQFKVLEAIEYYYQRNITLGSLAIQDIIENEVELIQQEPVPQIKEKPKEISPSQVNFDQVSPTQEQDKGQAIPESKFFKIEEYYTKHPDYCNQLLYYKYLQIIFWFDGHNELFADNFYDYMNIKIPISPILEYFQYQLSIIGQYEMPDQYFKLQSQCELGKYLVINQKKWLEQTQTKCSDIIESQDFQYTFTQIMKFSLLSQTYENRGILTKVIQLEEDQPHKKLLKIRAIHQLLHFENYSPMNLLVYSPDFSSMENFFQDTPSYINELKRLHLDINLLKFQFNICGLESFKIYHYLSICFTFSQKHIENMAGLDFQIKQQLEKAKSVIASMIGLIEFYPQIMKKAQILRQADQRLLIDDKLNSSQFHQCLNSQFFLTQYRNYSLMDFYNLIKDQWIEQCQPELIVLSFILYYFQSQQLEMAEVVLTFAIQLSSLKANIFENSYPEFSQDLEIFKSCLKQTYSIIAPYDLLYKRKQHFSIENFDLINKCKIVLFQYMYHQNFEESLEFIQEMLNQFILLYPQLQKNTLQQQENEKVENEKVENEDKQQKNEKKEEPINPKHAKLIYILKSLKLLILAYTGEFDSEQERLISEIKIVQNTYAYIILKHILVRYYIHCKNYQKAYPLSIEIINFLFTIDMNSQFVIQQAKYKQTYLPNNSKFTYFNDVKKLKIIDEETDYQYIHLIDKEFKNEAILNQIDILSNLDQDLPNLAWITDLFKSFKTEYHSTYLFKILAQIFINSANQDNIEQLSNILLVNINERTKKINKQKKVLKKQQMNLIVLKQYTAEDAKQFDSQMNILNYQSSIFDAVMTSGITKKLIINWAVTSAEKSIQIAKQMMMQYRKQSHFLVPENQLILLQCYENLQLIENSKQQIDVIENEILLNYDKKKCPILGLFYYQLGLFRQWEKEMFENFLFDLENVKLTGVHMRQLIIHLVQENKSVITLIDNFNKHKADTDLQKLILKLFPNFQLSDKQVSIEIIQGLFKDLCQQLSSIDYDGIRDFTDAYSVFSFFNVSNTITNHISEVLTNRQKNQQY